MPETTAFVYYPGHLGPEPRTTVEGNRGITWQPGMVRELPRPVVTSLVRYSGFRACRPVETSGLSKKALRKLEVVEWEEVRYVLAPALAPPVEEAAGEGEESESQTDQDQQEGGDDGSARERQ